MRYVFPTRSRTGSQFVLKLALSLKNINKTNDNYAGITGSRDNTNEEGNEFKQRFLKGEGIKYLKDNNIEIMKYEDPAKDDFILDIAKEFPNCKFIASHRDLKSVINSHYNIKKWGHSINDVLYQFKYSLFLYEKLHAMNRLFLIDVDNPKDFNLDKFCNFMGLSYSDDTALQVFSWLPINDLKYQKEKHDGGYNEEDIKEHPYLKILDRKYPWIKDIEKKYNKLLDQMKD